MERIPRPASTGRECRHCKFFDTITDLQNPGIQATVCRHNPPSVHAVVIGMNPGPVDMKGQPVGPPQPVWSQCNAWPAVQPSDWCGSFMRKLEEAK